MLTEQQINRAVERLVETADPKQILLFGSYARGDAGEDSDLDLLVVEDVVSDRAAEMVRLRRALRPLRIPVMCWCTLPQISSLGEISPAVRSTGRSVKVGWSMVETRLDAS